MNKTNLGIVKFSVSNDFSIPDTDLPLFEIWNVTYQLFFQLTSYSESFFWFEMSCIQNYTLKI